MSGATQSRPRRAPSFRHEALLYGGREEFVAATLPFIRDALDAGEPILVVVTPAKIALLRGVLGADAERVFFADMAQIGRNPARIIPAWRSFLADHTREGRRVRGVGEPVWPGRSSAELAECRQHESLLNVAFADADDFWLVCPYDAAALDASVLDGAHQTHPSVRWGDESAAGAGGLADPLAESLPDPPAAAFEMRFNVELLRAVRDVVARRAAHSGLSAAQADDLALAVNELATNTLRYGGGAGTLRMWHEGDRLVCEIRDGGHIAHPLAGRERPPGDIPGGRGLWMVNQLCDLVQLRSSANGTAVRLHMWHAS